MRRPSSRCRAAPRIPRGSRSVPAGSVPGLEQHHQIGPARERPPLRPARAPASSSARRASRAHAARTAGQIRPHADLGRPSAPPRRCACSRCSGTGCRRARPDLLVGGGSDARSSRLTAASTMPGVQMPHCAPPCSRNACCTACSTSASATPSIVVISAPSACTTAQAAVHELAVHEHRAGAALAFAAALLGAGRVSAATRRAARRAAAAIGCACELTPAIR